MGVFIMKKEAEIIEYSFEPKWREDAKRAYLLIEEMGAIWNITDENINKLMKGAIDVHVHAGPDPLIDTGWDQVEIAKKACDAGMKAIVFKAHTIPTAITVPFVQKIIDEYARTNEKERTLVLGGITLNSYVGGLNPKAVEIAAKLGGKVVWLPSNDSAHHHRVLGQEGGIELLNSEGNILPELKSILEIIAQYDMVLDPCHAGTKERFTIINAAKEIGVKRIIITHPNWNVTRASIDQQAEMAKNGAYIGLFMYGTVPHFNNPNCDPLEFLEIIKKVGANRIILATDLGTALNVHPVEGMRLFMRILLACNVSIQEIELMVKKNPTVLLGL
jgi:predicted metal-dependent TIM-barrel fold hydrolase